MESIKRLLPMIVIGVLGIALLAYGRIPQSTGYHAFADTRSMWGVANAGNVLSNLGFLVVGAWALGFIARRRHDLRYMVPALALFAVALVLTAQGSAYYHLAPSNARLVWDRLPLAMACGSLLAAAYIRTHETHLTLTLPLASAALGIATVFWWSLTEARGVGDLRPYILLQAAPLLLVPLWQWRARSPKRERVAFGLAVLLYVLAKLAELGDRAIFDALGVLSGHTLKHLLAAAASFLIVWSLAAPLPPEAG